MLANMTKVTCESVFDHLSCASCGNRHPRNLLGACPDCNGPMVAKYDLSRLSGIKPEILKDREVGMWRFRELLPLIDWRHRVTMGEGFTPIIRLPRLGRMLGFDNLWFKDESVNPGHTFKARGAAMGISKARELGIDKVAITTNGNAGEAWALYGARAGVQVTVLLPVDAQDSVKAACALSGARTLLVDGLISDGGTIIASEARPNGWCDVSTLKEPFRLEGKKTMGFEIAEQFDWQLPDAILFPTGGGINIIAMYKAFKELEALGWIHGKLPRLIAVQAEGCAPFAEAFRRGDKGSRFCEGARTLANGLRVPKSFGDFMVLEAIYETDGQVITATDEELAGGVVDAARAEGLMLCPEAGILVPGLEKLLAKGLLRRNETVVLMGTGSAYKYKEPMTAPSLNTYTPDKPTGLNW